MKSSDLTTIPRLPAEVIEVYQAVLAAKLGVHEDNVADGQHHAKAPPDQANGKRVRSGDGAAKSDVAIRAGGCRQQRGIVTSQSETSLEQLRDLEGRAKLTRTSGELRSL